MRELLTRNFEAFTPKKVDSSIIADKLLYINSDAKPRQRKPKFFRKEDLEFISTEVKRIYELCVIQRSQSQYSYYLDIATKANEALEQLFK